MPPSDPNHKMEELLRAYAKKRREEAGPPLELPPGVRARLQEEVGRALGKTTHPPRRRWGLPMAWWLRLAFGGAAVAAVILMVRSKPPPAADTMKLASANRIERAREIAPAPAAASQPQEDQKIAGEPSALAKAEREAAPPVLTAPAPAQMKDESGTVAATAAAMPATNAPVMRLDDELAKNADADALAFNRAAAGSHETPAPAPVSPAFAETTRDTRAFRGGGGGFGGGGGGAAGSVGSVGSVGGVAEREGKPPVELAYNYDAAASDKSDGAKAGKMAAGNSGQFTFAQRLVRSDLSSVQSDSLVAGANKKLNSPPAGVLASFQIERSGQQVRVVDADGSGYLGLVVEAVVPGKSQLAEKEVAVTRAFEPPRGAVGAAQNAGALMVENNVQANGIANASQPVSQSLALDAARQNQAPAYPAPGFSGLAQPSAAPPQQAGLIGGFTFQVSGMNRKLRQNVTVTGDFFSAPVPYPGQLMLGDTSNQAQSNVSNNYMGQNAAPKGQFWRVTGKVQIGQANQFDLDAITLQP